MKVNEALGVKRFTALNKHKFNINIYSNEKL